jgi:hypothetical protein
MLDVNVDIVGSALVLSARFKLNVADVNPANTLSGVANSLKTTLLQSSADFQAYTSSFGSTFSSASEFLSDIAQSDKINLALNASIDIDARLDLSLDNVQLITLVNELKASFTGSMTDEYHVTIGGFEIFVTPYVQLHLQAENTDCPFDVVNNSNALSEFSFGGDFAGLVVVRMDGIPAAISLSASSEDITSADSLIFELRLDIDLLPIKNSE